jgi:hypothetical protein
MKPASLGWRLQRRAQFVTVSLALAGGAVLAQAADVQVNAPPGGNVVFKDSSGATTLLQVQGTGPVTVPSLPTSPTYTTGVCFNGAGVLGQCATLVGPPGPAGPQGIPGPAGPAGPAGTGTGLLVGPKAMTLSAPGITSLASWPVPLGDAAGGYIAYTIVATDGGSQIVTETGTILYNATTNSITCTAPVAQQVHRGTVNSGCTPGFFNPGSQPGVSIFDNVVFFSPAPIVTHFVYFEIHNVSGPATRLEP